MAEPNNISVQLALMIGVGSFLVFEIRVTGYYYSHPYATMGSDAIIDQPLAFVDESRYVSPEELMEVEHDAAAYSYRMLVGTDRKLVETFVYGFVGLSEDGLNCSQFNGFCTGVRSITGESVLVDSGTARQLQVSVGDKIRLIQRSTGTEVSVVISDIYPAYGSMFGIVLDANLLVDADAEGMLLYTSKDVVDHLADQAGSGEGFAISLLESAEGKQQMIRNEEMRAKSFFPRDGGILLTIVGCILPLLTGLVYGVARIRKAKRGAFFPLEAMGASRLVGYGSYFISCTLCFVVPVVCGLVLVTLVVHWVFHFDFTGMELLYLLVLEYGMACLGAGLPAVTRYLRGRV